MEELGISTRAAEPTFDDVVAEKTAVHQHMAQEQDTFLRYKKLTQHLEFLSTMEDYVVSARPVWRSSAGGSWLVVRIAAATSSKARSREQ